MAWRGDGTGYGAYPVTDLIRPPARTIWQLTLRDAEGNTEVFETTDDHPWHAPVYGTFLRTDALEAGMVLSTQDGDGVTVLTVDKTDNTAPTYNLTVADAHTFFVGDDGIWVHNVNNCLNVDESGNVLGFKDPEVQDLYSNSTVRDQFTPKEFAELAFDLDKGKINAGSVAELEAAAAARRQGLIKGEIRQADVPGSDFSSTLGENIDIKAPRDNPPFFRDSQEIRSFVGRLKSNPDTRIVIDPRNASDSAIENILKQIEDAGGDLSRIDVIGRGSF